MIVRSCASISPVYSDLWDKNTNAQEKKLATLTESRSSFRSGFYHRQTQKSLNEISGNNI